MDTNWAQIIFNSGVTGSIYLISAVAITLIYGLSRFPNFAHAEFMALGAFLGYLASVQIGLAFPFTFIIAFLGCGALGFLSYWGIFRPLLNRGASLIHLMIASLALGYIIRHTIAEIWGWSPLYYGVIWANFDIGPVRVSVIWLLIILAAFLVAITMHFVLTRSKLGKSIRATSSNPKLAQSSGINTLKVILITWFIAAGLAGLAGLLRAAQTKIGPMVGWDILLPSFAVTLLGGIGSFYGAILAAYTIGLAENVGVVFLARYDISTDYRMAIPFVILILVLLFRPQGMANLFKGN